MTDASPDCVQIHEGMIDLPKGFEDRTTNLFVPANIEQQPNLSIARDTLKQDETLEAYVSRQLGVLKARLSSHKLIRRGPALLGPEDSAIAGELIDAQYKNGVRTVFQRQAAFVLGEQRALIFTASSARHFDTAFEALWQAWLASFRARPNGNETQG
jgi:hypothetical protein